MRVKQSVSESAITAWGIGFCYEYDPALNLLTVIHARRYKPLIDIDLSQTPLEKPAEFVDLLERTTQVQALMLSNNETADITEILSTRKLSSYLENTMTTALMALLLKQGNYEGFEEIFCDRYEMKSLSINSVAVSFRTEEFKIEVITHKGNRLETQSAQLHNAMSALSKQIISDLIIQETGHNFQPDAQRLLSASSKLSTLSLILNEKFAPRRKMIRKKQSIGSA